MSSASSTRGGAVGVAITDFTIELAEAEPQQRDGLRSVPAPSPQCPIPAAAVLGGLSGEPLIVDLSAPASIAGSGLAWPPSAQVDIERGSSRFPIACAWPMLEKGVKWRWKPGGRRSTTCAPAEAIAASVRAGLCTSGYNPHAPELAFVVPNATGVDAQDELLRAIRLGNGIQGQLLWRPVAAALAWVEQYGGQILKNVPISTESGDQLIGQLLVIHLGLDAFELTRLELIVRHHDGNAILLPARRLPDLHPLDNGGLDWAEFLADQVLPLSDKDHLPWALLWTTPWLRNTVCGNNDPLLARQIRSMFGGAIEQATNKCFNEFRQLIMSPYPSTELSPSRLTQLRRRMMTESGQGDHAPVVLENWLSRFRQWGRECRQIECWDLPLLGIVGTGAFIDLGYDGRRLRDQLLPRTLLLTDGSRSLFDPTSRVLCSGAAYHMGRRRLGIPTYLDVLPQLELLVIRGGEPRFEDILRSETRYVVGGREECLDRNDLGLFVAKESKEITLSLWREGHDTVRTASAQFPRTFLERVPVGLKMWITSGQGNPRVEVNPQDATAFAGVRAYLDWSRATDSGRSRDEELMHVPRTNPPCEPREASSDRWAKLLEIVRECLPAIRAHRLSELMKRVISIREAVRLNDPKYATGKTPIHATALSSAGTPPPNSSGWNEFQALIDVLDDALTDRRYARHQTEIMRILGYCSSNCPNLLNLLRKQLTDGGGVKPHHLIAIGNCFRDPSDVARFAEAMRSRLCDEGAAGTNWMNALSRILRYRLDAAREMTSGLCEALSEACLPYMQAQLRERKIRYKYRYASLSIVYLLRRRRFDDGYMDPDSQCAKRIVALFRDAIKACKARALSVMGGIVDLPLVTEMMIQYVNRQGHGHLQGLSATD